MSSIIIGYSGEDYKSAMQVYTLEKLLMNFFLVFVVDISHMIYLSFIGVLISEFWSFNFRKS